MTQAFLDRYPLVLGEGSMYERLRRGGSDAFDPEIAYAGMVYDEFGQEVLAATHRKYLDLEQHFGLPMVAGTPTWRVSAIGSCLPVSSTASINRQTGTSVGSTPRPSRAVIGLGRVGRSKYGLFGLQKA